MNLVKNYSLAAGVPIGKPKIREEYFPLIVDNFITIQSETKPSKSYSYFQEVIDLIKPYLDKLGICIVQLGQNGEKSLNHCLHLQGKTSINNCNYVIKRSKLHFGCDSFLSHVAGIYNIKRVILFSNNTPENVGSYFGSPENQISIEAPGTKKPIYVLDEGPIKRINNIFPETIASSILKLLNIDHNFDFKTLEFGPLYNTKIMEMTPTQVVNPGQFGAEKMIIRMDFFYNEAILVEQLKVCPCIIFTNKEINREILKAFTNQRIHQIIYILGENNSNPEFIKFCQSLGININIISYLPEETINKFKLDYCELGIIHKKHILNPKENDKYKNLDNLYFKSGKTILHDNKFYASFAHILNNVSMPNLEQGPQKIIDSLTFWKDWEHFYFLNKASS